MRRSTRSAVVVLLAVALTAILLDLRGGSVTAGIRHLAAVVVSPVQRAAGAVANPFVTWVEGAEAFPDQEERARLWAAQAPPAAPPRAAVRVAELDGLLAATSAANLRVVPARVVAYPGSGPAVETAQIDVGADDGVQSDRAVFTGVGLVGRTTAVTTDTTSVQLISAPGSSVGVRLGRSGEAAVLAGTGNPSRLVLKVLAADADVRIGDTVATFGSKQGRPFPPDIPVGTVTAIDGDIVHGRVVVVTPTARLSAIDLVGVDITAELPDRRLPLAAPTAAVTR